jgi:hypothetical protein
MYSHLVTTVNAATAALTANGDTFEITGLLYLQGESDSTAEADLAGTRFHELVNNLRADLPNAANLKAVIGGIAAAGGETGGQPEQQEAARQSHGPVAHDAEVCQWC